MFKNYLRTMLRNLLKYKMYSSINILGLAVGLMCTLLILLWVHDELSVDNYHVKRDRIAQAYLKGIQDKNANFQETVSPAIAPMLLDNYPEVIDAVRMGRLQEVVLKYENKMIIESSGAVSDPAVFSIFSYEFIEGNQNALDDPHAIVLTASTARKYFGDEEPVGKILTMDNTFDFHVTGVIRDLPANAYRKFDFLVPFVFLKELGYDITGTSFYPCNYLTYVLLDNHVDIQNLSDKVSKLIFSKGKEITFEICLIPFNDVYSFDTGGRLKSIILILIASFILSIACINFMNLSTARSMIRAKEIGVRKVTGASRFEIAKQFLSESIFLTLIAAILALGLVEFSLPYFNRITGKVLAIQLDDPLFVAGMLGLILLTGILAGIYPAVYLSGFDPVRILKNTAVGSTRKSYRQVLIVFQFILSIFFIICTILLSRQIHYLRTFNYGINKNNIIYVRLDGDVIKKYDMVKNELVQNPNITHVTSASVLPIAVSSGSFWIWGINDKIGRRICPIFVGYDFLETFDIKMADGRFYSQEYSRDASESIIVNETAIRKIGLENPVGKPFFFDRRYFNLVGIVRDYQHNSPLNCPTEPMVFWLKPGGDHYLFVKINPAITDIETITATVHHIDKICNRFSPERPLNCRFMSDFSFQTERDLLSLNQLILTSTILMIFVACLGLYGLTAFLNERKTKEIGIRKALGASVTGIVIMLSREFCKWVLLANIFAWPLAYYAVRYLLQDYAYRISISLWVFIAAGFSAFIIALFTVSWQAIRAATVNPVEALRYE
jgi:putative ABC transport system permease protein